MVEKNKFYYHITGSNLLKRTEQHLSRLTIYPSCPIFVIFLNALEALSPVILYHIDWTTDLYVSLLKLRPFCCKVHLKCYP